MLMFTHKSVHRFARYDILWFCSGKVLSSIALNLGVLPMIVHPAARCDRHCLFAKLSDFETVNSHFLVRRLVALSFRQNIAH